MNNSEFINATSRLEKYYDKEYSSDQLKIMYDFLKEWDLSRYIQAINACLKQSKYLPKLADIMNANVDKMSYTEKKKIDFVECDKCNGEGFIKYFKLLPNGDKKIQYEYIALCTCENAQKQRTENQYDLPTLAEVGL